MDGCDDASGLAQVGELDPNSAAGHQEYAYLLTALGRHDDAIAAVKRARELDPLALAINVNLGWRYY